MHITQHLNVDGKIPGYYTSHEAVRHFFLYLEVQIYIQLWIRTADTEH